MNRKMKRRAGMTMVELLGVMVVLAILAMIAVGGVLTGAERARMTQANTALQGYVDAFTNVCTYTPAVVNDRAQNWPNEADYTGKMAYQKLVQRMNELLDDSLDFTWDDAQKCYVSRGDDPWGGKYIMTEYPIAPDGSVNYFDPTAGGAGMMCFSVWCTGNNDAIQSEKIVGEESVGAGIIYTGGLVSTKTHGVDGEEQPFTGWELKFQ